MSQQGPIIVVSTAGRPSFATALDDAKMFPVIETTWSEAALAIGRDHDAFDRRLARVSNALATLRTP